MSSYYYLISSLPMPVLGEKQPQSLDSFMDSCSNWVSASEYRELKNISLIPDHEKVSKNFIVNQWKNWDTCLRNSVSKTRSGALNRDATPFLQEERNAFSEIERGVQESFSAENPMLKEKTIDELRWRELDNLEAGHLFDFSKLCIYKLRLMLCAKWLTRETEKGERNLDAVLLKFYSPEKNNDEEISDVNH